MENNQRFQGSRNYLLWLTAIEYIRKCLLVKLITNLATVPVSNYSVWVTLFSIPTSLCTLARCQPHGAVNLYIDLPVCFPLSLPFFLQMNCHIPSAEHQSILRNLPQSQRCQIHDGLTQSTFSTQWNLRTHKPNLAWICTFPLRLINQASWELPCSRLVFSFPVN